MHRKLVEFGIAFCVSFSIGCIDGNAQVTQASTLHIQQTQTTAQAAIQSGFPTYLAMYHVLDSGHSTAQALGLTGTISLKNASPNFSEVLWVLVYWQGDCPANDIDLAQNPGYLWSNIIKNPSQSEAKYEVNQYFPRPLPMTGCIGLYYGGGSLIQGEVTMSADLELTYEQVKENANSVVDLTGEYCFGQNWGCENATDIDEEAFAVPIQLPAGHLAELIGNIDDSTFDGTPNFGPLPTGAWAAINEFYLLPGGCGIFQENVNAQGTPNPLPLATVRRWLPHNARLLESLTLSNENARQPEAQLQGQVEKIFPIPVKVDAGACLLAVYGRKGNGATDNETQVRAVMTP